MTHQQQKQNKTHSSSCTDFALSRFIHNTGERVFRDFDGVAVCWRAGVVVRLRDDYAGAQVVFFFFHRQKEFNKKMGCCACRLQKRLWPPC